MCLHEGIVHSVYHQCLPRSPRKIVLWQVSNQPIDYLNCYTPAWVPNLSSGIPFNVWGASYCVWGGGCNVQCGMWYAVCINMQSMNT